LPPRTAEKTSITFMSKFIYSAITTFRSFAMKHKPL